MTAQTTFCSPLGRRPIRRLLVILGSAAAILGGCARSDNYFGDRPSSRLSGPTAKDLPTAPQTHEPYGTYRGGRDPRSGLATSTAPWQTAPPNSTGVPTQATAPHSKNPALTKTITVMTGDTLYSLAKAHHVSISALMEMNGLASATLQPGQSLRIR